METKISKKTAKQTKKQKNRPEKTTRVKHLEIIRPVKPKKNDDWDDDSFFTTLLKVRNGDFSVRMPVDRVGLKGKIYDTLNEIIELNEKMVIEFEKVGHGIGKQGKLTQRVEIDGAR